MRFDKSLEEGLRDSIASLRVVGLGCIITLRLRVRRVDQEHAWSVILVSASSFLLLHILNFI